MTILLQLPVSKGLISIIFSEDLVKVQKELVDVRWLSKNDKATLYSVKGTVDHLEGVIREKTDAITQ